jgi:uncharacterized protein
MKKSFFMLLLAMIGFAIITNAQKYSSEEWISRGIKAHEKQDYAGAISNYANVLPTDTNALVALYETAFSYSKDSTKYKECLETIDKALVYPLNDLRIQLLELRASIYDLQKKYDECYAIYDTLIVKYPFYHQPYFEKGISYFNRKMYDLAAEYFQKSLLLNPYHTRSHTNLGISYLRQGRLAEAYMAIQASLLTTSRGSEFTNSVINLNYINEMNDSVINYQKNKLEKYKNETFDEIDDLLISKIALSKDFQLKTEIDDKLTRTLQVILEKVKYKEEDKSFPMQFYVPMYQEVFKNDFFDPFVVLLYSDYGIKQVDKYAKKIKGDVKEVKVLVYDYIDNILGTREIDYSKRKKMDNNFYLMRNENVFVEGKVKKNDNEEKIFVGDAKLYRNQILLAQGKYNAEGKREGVWKFYYGHGPVKSEETFEDGKVTKVKRFTRNGTIKTESVYNEKDEVTEEINYWWNGNKMNKSILLEKNKVDYTTFHKNGEKEVQYIIYKKEIEDGDYEIKNDNKTSNRKFSIVKGKPDGELKIYNNKNILISSGYTEKGKREGEFIERYNNGNLKSKYNYTKDLKDGEYIIYNARGVVSEKGNYEKGKLEGEVITYDAAGKEKCNNNYENGTMITATFADSNMMQYNSKKVRRIRNATGAGTLYSDYMLNEDGEMNGMVNIYYLDGSKQEERSYKAGIIQNELRKYFANGQLLEVFKYKEGKLNGPYIQYNKQGKTIIVGQYVDDEQEGFWYTYNDKDIKIEERYFLDGKLNGPRNYFESDGKLRMIEWYNVGLFCATSNCDSNGKILQTIYFNNPDSSIIAYNLLNKLRTVRQRKNGVLNGNDIMYFVDGNVQQTVSNIDGDYEGKFVSYNVNGSINEEGEYKNDKKVGKWKRYNDVGNLFSEIEYDEDGNQIFYQEYLDNNLRITEEIMDGDICGKKIIYGEDKKIACVLIYDRDNLVAYTYEDKNGQLLPEKKIISGTGKVETFYSNGSKGVSYDYKNGYPEGKQISYYSNGKIADERVIKSLEFNGVWRQYATNGQLVLEANLIDGDYEGEEKFYNSNGELLGKVNYYNDEKHGKASFRKKGSSQMIECVYRYGNLLSVK